MNNIYSKNSTLSQFYKDGILENEQQSQEIYDGNGLYLEETKNGETCRFYINKEKLKSLLKMDSNKLSIEDELITLFPINKSVTSKSIKQTKKKKKNSKKNKKNSKNNKKNKK